MKTVTGHVVKFSGFEHPRGYPVVTLDVGGKLVAIHRLRLDVAAQMEDEPEVGDEWTVQLP